MWEWWEQTSSPEHVYWVIFRPRWDLGPFAVLSGRARVPPRAAEALVQPRLHLAHPKHFIRLITSMV